MRSVVIVGAGIAGLVAATACEAAGFDVVVIDKGRGVGGRTATRRIGAATFDHGAQFFTARSDEMRQMVEAWRAAGVVAEWHRRLLHDDATSEIDGHVRWRGRQSTATSAGAAATA